MRQQDVMWGGILATGAVAEVWAIKNSTPGDTLSECLRSWFRVDTRTGKVVFTACWMVFSSWLLHHVVG